MEVNAEPAMFFHLFLVRRGRSSAPGRGRWTDKLRWRPCTFCGLEKRLFDWAVSLRRCRGFFTWKKLFRGQDASLTADFGGRAGKVFDRLMMQGLEAAAVSWFLAGWTIFCGDFCLVRTRGGRGMFFGRGKFRPHHPNTVSSLKVLIIIRVIYKTSEIILHTLLKNNSKCIKWQLIKENGQTWETTLYALSLRLTFQAFNLIWINIDLFFIARCFSNIDF